MKIQALLSEMASNKIFLWVESGKLRYKAHQGTLTGLPRETLVEHKQQVIAYLQQRGFTVPPGPLSFGQRSLWYLGQISRANAAYNVCLSFKIFGALDRSLLLRACGILAERHPQLRARFTSLDEVPLSLIEAKTRFVFREFRLASTHEKVWAERIKTDYEKPFNLELDSPMRVHLYETGNEEFVLLLVFHHIAVDFQSLMQFAKELFACYEGRVPEIQPESSNYSNFVAWQAELVKSPRGQVLENYWRNRLKGPLPVLALPTDHTRPPLLTYQGGSFSFSLEAGLIARLRAFAREENCTVFTVLLAVYQVFLYRYSGQEDLIVGAPVAGRPAPFAKSIGDFINMLPYRADLSGRPDFRGFLHRVRDSVLDAVEHGDYPFLLMAEQFTPHRDAAHSPIFQVMFNLVTPGHFGDVAELVRGGTGVSVPFGNCVARPFPMEQQEGQYELCLEVVEKKSGFLVVLKYNSGLFEPATARRMASSLHTLLAGVLKNPDQELRDYQLLSPAIRERVLNSFNATAAPYAAQHGIQDRFEQRVAQDPNRTALFFEVVQLSFGELNEHANRLAHHLLAFNPRSQAPIGICLSRSDKMVVGLLAILKTGRPYLPLDPSYPKDRLGFMIKDARLELLLCEKELAAGLPPHGARPVYMDEESETIAHCSPGKPQPAAACDLAYITYTSGSTGKPKGVMVSHRNVMNFFAGMTSRLGEGGGTWLAVTSISFDISVLEIFWALCRGFRVIIQAELMGGSERSAAQTSAMDFSLFYFASGAPKGRDNPYRLLMEGARFADEHKFSAVWVPERHFHNFGALYPAPSVLAGALAAITRHIKIRTGSVVLPLHHPVRVAEEWSVVDNLSNGRVQLSFACGWHPNDFIFFPENYAERKPQLYEKIETVRKLWRGEAVVYPGGNGEPVEVRVFPRPRQARLPVFITASGAPDTYKLAGEKGEGLLTHLLGKHIYGLANNIERYRAAWRQAGHAGRGHVAVMIHCFVAEDPELPRRLARGPLREYLNTSADLMRVILDIGPSGSLADEDHELMLSRALDRFFDEIGLFGTPESCLERIDELKKIGVDEVACLIDFGIETNVVLENLTALDRLRRLSNRKPPASRSLAQNLEEHTVTHLQCTPSLARMMLEDPVTRTALFRVKTLLLGGEPLPGDLAAELLAGGCRLHNMYGPTETTVWSSTSTVTDPNAINIGRPIANTTLYIVNGSLQSMPIGVPGELLIGGHGVTRGYLGRAALTAERYIPDPFGAEPGFRLYRTGDRVKARGNNSDGIDSLIFLGRLDNQVKVRGQRIELGEIEAVINSHAKVGQAAIILRRGVSGEFALVAYVAPAQNRRAKEDTAYSSLPTKRALLDYLRQRLPEAMIPSLIVTLDRLPLTPNGKVDRGRLPDPGLVGETVAGGQYPPRDALELQLVSTWEEILGRTGLGIRSHFFELGGHSLMAVRLVGRIRDQTGQQLPPAALFRFPTIELLADKMRSATTEPACNALVPIHAMGKQRPIFCVHPIGGNVLCYRELARELGQDQPFYGLQSVGLEGTREPLADIREMAEAYLEEVRQVQAKGPYRLSGWSVGGVIAMEMALQCLENGDSVELLAMIDSYAPRPEGDETGERARITSFVEDLSGLFGKPLPISVEDLKGMDPERQLHLILEEARANGFLPPEIGPIRMHRLLQVFEANSRAVHNYQPRPYPEAVHLFWAEQGKAGSPAPGFHGGWDPYLTGSIQVHRVPGSHYDIMREDGARVIAAKISGPKQVTALKGNCNLKRRISDAVVSL